MFLTLLLVTFVIALVVATIVARIFDAPTKNILVRIIADDISLAWHKYVKFAIYVVGVSGGVRIWELERYITPWHRDREPLVLNTERWVLEIYRTIIQTLQSIAWMLLVFFVIALVAYVIVRLYELKQSSN